MNSKIENFYKIDRMPASYVKYSFMINQEQTNQDQGSTRNEKDSENPSTNKNHPEDVSNSHYFRKEAGCFIELCLYYLMILYSPFNLCYICYIMTIATLIQRFGTHKFRTFLFIIKNNISNYRTILFIFYFISIVLFVILYPLLLKNSNKCRSSIIVAIKNHFPDPPKCNQSLGQNVNCTTSDNANCQNVEKLNSLWNSILPLVLFCKTVSRLIKIFYESFNGKVSGYNTPPINSFEDIFPKKQNQT